MLDLASQLVGCPRTFRTSACASDTGGYRGESSHSRFTSRTHSGWIVDRCLVRVRPESRSTRIRYGKPTHRRRAELSQRRSAVCGDGKLHRSHTRRDAVDDGDLGSVQHERRRTNERRDLKPVGHGQVRERSAWQLHDQRDGRYVFTSVSGDHSMRSDCRLYGDWYRAAHVSIGGCGRIHHCRRRGG